MSQSDKPEYIQLEDGEDVPSVRDRLSFIRGKRVLLIWPERGTALTRKLDLVLIQREARRRVLQLALVTHDKTVILNARDLGISTFETIAESERSRWKRIKGRVFVQRHHKPTDSPAPDDLMPIASRLRGPQRQLPLLAYIGVRVAVLVVLVAVIGGAAYIALPGASVSLQLARETINIDISIQADPNVSDVDVENGIIPAVILRATSEAQGTLQTTGRQDVANIAARGVVTVTNQTNRAVTIPQNTTVSTSAGTPILFGTLAPVTLPAGIGERADVEVEALPSSSGVIGNVDAGLINVVAGPLGEQVSVRNLAPTSGGGSRGLATVTNDDRERLRLIVRAQIQQAAYEQMQVNLSDSQAIVISTIRIAEERRDWMTYSHEAGEISDTLSLSMRAIVEALVIDDRFGRQIVFARLSSQKPAGLSLQPDSFTYERGNVTALGANDAITFAARGQAQAVGEINAAQLQSQLAGQDLAAVPDLISGYADLMPGTQPIITLSPDWLAHMPLLPIRIQINIVDE